MLEFGHHRHPVLDDTLTIEVVFLILVVLQS